MLTQTIAPFATTDFAAEVRSGLSRLGQKELPSKYFYDEVGSALFEVISVMPEYGLTRAPDLMSTPSSMKQGPSMVAPTSICTSGATEVRGAGRLRNGVVW